MFRRAFYLPLAVASVAVGCASSEGSDGSSSVPPGSDAPTAGVVPSPAPLGGNGGGPASSADSTATASSGGNAGLPTGGPVPTSAAPGGNGGGPTAGATSSGAPSENGGMTTGGNATGGTAAGGIATGGNATGGMATGGNATGGNAAGTSNASGGQVVGMSGSSSGGSSGASAVNPEAPEPFTFGEPPTAASHFKTGINLGNRLEAPNEGDWGGRVLASDFPFIAARGFDHVRIPMRFSGHALTGAPYTIDASFFERIDEVLEQAMSAGLAVIIDMHAYDEMASDPNAQRERFLALWSQIAERYRGLPDTVAFELLNEPNTALDTVWNDIAAAAISTVRETNPRRLLVVDSVFWADPSKLSLLTLPDDANLLVSIHLYEPKLFSFQGKSWMGEPYMTTGVVFPGPPAAPIAPVQAALDESWAAAWFDDYNTLPAATNPSGPATIDAQMAYITAYENASGRTVYNGEWGPQDAGDMTSRANLVRMVRERCEAEDIGWAIWEDPNNMQLFDSAAGTWVTPIIDALLP